MAAAWSCAAARAIWRAATPGGTLTPARCAGALLCPQGLSDGELICLARLPRRVVGEQVKPGRGYVDISSGVLITIALLEDA